MIEMKMIEMKMIEMKMIEMIRKRNLGDSETASFWSVALGLGRAKSSR